MLMNFHAIMGKRMQEIKNPTGSDFGIHPVFKDPRDYSAITQLTFTYGGEESIWKVY